MHSSTTMTPLARARLALILSSTARTTFMMVFHGPQISLRLIVIEFASIVKPVAKAGG
jgi:hypothetical protein